MYLSELKRNVKNWFDINELDHAVVGFSGGIDSAVTAALCAEAGIKTTIAQVCLKHQKLSSSILPMVMCSGWETMRWEYIEMPPISDFLNDSGKEAVLPIIRNAYFYGLAAQIRDSGDSPIIVGTVNFDEAAYLGFWGKASDAAQDFYPISHLHKSQVYDLARELNIPQEIIEATPSGDLQWSGDLNDYRMIGASYDQIENLAKLAQNNSYNITQDDMVYFIMHNIDDPRKFADNIVRNRHKYDRKFPNIHLYDTLEQFRVNNYKRIFNAALIVSESV